MVSLELTTCLTLIEKYLFLISAVMAIKASSTLVELLALVSRNGIPISSANACTPKQTPY
ncbi:hypothetical protein Hanom_Chr03g00270841 [Helianthus anomalus]